MHERSFRKFIIILSKGFSKHYSFVLLLIIVWKGVLPFRHWIFAYPNRGPDMALPPCIAEQLLAAWCPLHNGKKSCLCVCFGKTIRGSCEVFVQRERDNHSSMECVNDLHEQISFWKLWVLSQDSWPNTMQGRFN